MKKEILKLCFKPVSIINKYKRKKENLVFFYSNLGFRDNVRAVFDYMINNGFNNKYRIVCAVNNPDEFIELKNANPALYKNVDFVGLKQGIAPFLNAKYGFYSFGKYPIKPSKDQVIVNVWHGVPLKKIGNMEQGKEKIDYNFFTYLISNSDYFKEIMMKSFNCDESQIIINGQPRTDIMFKKDEVVDKRIRQDKDKLIVWMPTFRNTEAFGDDRDKLPVPILDEAIMEKLNDMLAQYNAKLAIKLHPLQYVDEASFKELKYTNIELLSHEGYEKLGINLYEYLRNADALITDYSSVYFDYLLLDRPIAFTVDDLSKYGEDRGFVFENPEEMMPGAFASSGEELMEFISKVLKNEDEYKQKRKVVNDLVNQYQDGKNTYRLLKKIMKNS